MSVTNSENFKLTRDNTLEITSSLSMGIAGPLYILTLFIQDNVYGRENFLKGVSDILGSPTFLTSYFVMLGVLSASLAAERKLANQTLLKYPLVLPFLLTLLYTSYEVYQAYHPKYVDNNAMDIVMGWLAFATVAGLYSGIARFEKEPAEPVSESKAAQS